MVNDPWASVDMTLDSAAFQVSMSGSSSGTSLNDLFSYAPPSLHLVSLASSVTVEDRAKTNAFGLTLTSAPEGTLELLAAGDVHLAVGKITLKDVAPEYAYDVLHAFSYTSAGVATLGISEDEGNNYRRGSTLLHQDDPDPVRIYAGGSVCAQTGGVCKRGKATKTNLNAVTVTAPKPIEVIAGVDVLGGQWQPQNNSSSDVSLIQAGRDVYDPILEVTGQGTAIIQAGRDVVLDDVPVNSSSTTGVSAPVLAGGAIYSLGSWTPAQGNTAPTEKTVKINSALSGTSAADVIVLAGTANGVDYAGFAAAYLDPANGQGVVRTYLAELRKYMDGLDGAKYAALSDAELYAAFQALSLLKREIFLDQVYFTELKETGIDYNDSSSTRYRSYDRGYEAVSLLFPTDPTTLTSAQRGDIVLAGKQVETEADASITLLAPYGSAQVGESIVAKGVDSTKGGVVTRRGGDISVMADGNIDLYTSRVFTDEGGDILMWTTDGSITAGSGSSTSVRYVPLTYTMDASATVEVDAFGLVTGAGIGVLDALGNAEGRTASRLDLIAPHGEVNAGDAGIRVVGDLNIAAQTVVGLENIKVSGTATGIPKVEVPSMSVASTANEMAQTAAREGLGPDPLAAQKALAELPSIITVEVVGYETTDQGDENGDPAKKRKPSPKAR